jgi:predicted DsbA family dithiol-disulfide isomerase
MLEGDDDLALVTREDQIAREMGVTGVPAMIFGNKLAVSGAREPQVLVSVIDRVREMAAGTPQAEAEEDDDSDED